MKNFSKANGVSYSFIKTNRFKTTLISVGFYLPTDDYAAANSLACALMSTGTSALADSESFNRRLASLYGASVSLSVTKLGDIEEFRLNLTVNDSRYSINGEDTADDAGKLLCDMIFGRFLAESSYPADAVSREKRLLCEKIAGEINDKRIFARGRCEEIMCEGEPYGMPKNGTVEQVNSLTDRDIREALCRLIRNSFISVIIIGKSEPVCFAESFDKCLTAAKRDYKPLPKDILHTAKPLRTVEEKMQVGQGKLVLGFRTGNGGNDTDTVSTWVMTDVFGGGPYSKLFCNVREKLSLCYYCSARAVRSKGLMFVDSGVEEKNIDAAKDAVLKELAAVANGDFTEKELNSSKLAMSDMIRSVESDQPSLMRWYAARALETESASPEQICEIIERVTAEDIKNAAKSFALDTVYILRPDGSVKEEE